MADQTGVPDYLQTVVAGKTSTTTVSASASNINGSGNVNQQPSTIQLPISVAQQVRVHTNFLNDHFFEVPISCYLMNLIII